MVPPYDEKQVPQVVRQLALRDEPRLAAFDADGVLWQGDIFEDFTRWLIAEGEISGERWPAYEELARRDSIAACYDILRFFSRMDIDRFCMLAERFWHRSGRRPWNEPVISTLFWAKNNGFAVYVVSATATPVLAPLVRHLPVDRILGLELAVDTSGRITGEVSGVPTVGPGKAERIRNAWPHAVQLALGNSILDIEMLRLARDCAWAFEPDGALLAAAQEAGWLVTPRA